MERKRTTENQRIIDSYDYLGKSVSSMDCTGLIPSAPKNQAERESYEELYPYLPDPQTFSENPDDN